MLARIVRQTDALRQALLDLLFPPRCVTCRRTGQWFCAACQETIEKILPPVCNRCGRPLLQRTCPYCEKLPLQIDGTRAVAFFEGNLRHAIHVLKYNHRPELAQPLGELLSAYLCAYPLPVDVLIPVPLHIERERARGYNQSALLAQVLGERTRLPVWQTALTRTRHTRPQIELDAANRRENVRDAFAAEPRVAGTRVLLIDDVCTTGATMDACGIALQTCGATSVWGLAIARSR